MPTVVICSTLGRAGSLLALVGTLGMVGSIWATGGPSSGLPATGWGLLFLLVVWGLWWAPRLILEEEHLTVRNAWRSHTISWRALERASASWTLILVLRDGATVTVNAAQRPGGLLASWQQHRSLHGTRAAGRATTTGNHHPAVREDLLTPADHPRRASLDAATAADLVTAYAERLATRCQLDHSAPPPSPNLVSCWNLPPLLVAVTGLALVCLGLVR
ncbi:PH domain-containing protein [Actinomyces trachealis]|uniref:PH domain-containing protein n=1 Tax=Actinomyces trachealis TaxID=2763540 RepID=UPI001892D0FA|nr:PH domain-containing protein [Actinomyces trachealis]